ncbi:hypothetical protein CMQ_7459 [Grosmannia clavigera kw1407]|uniref:HNH nuclease domain-containing protein n=1 Tax=Grosmannia clavigera (strain kw1407 / UAMH 11150) TaxID=655863 RepID=F0XQD1_GROCL|nr:uncharacterized protein CMQ_7459 [Grosmannia clavigera kw1407]EFX00457.1 hypothetical protein CMQ_7459 [Grosmannia clavigera kw1407]
MMVDDSRLLRIEVGNDWAYIDGILRALRNPYNATKTIKSTRPGNTQARFRKTLAHKYEAAQSAKKPMESLWCPIVGAFCDGLMMRAAHIVKKNVGENVAQALFGETTDSQGHIWQPSNGLLINRRYEMWLDAGVIVIVPDDDAENEFKVVVLDMSAFDDAIDYSIPVGTALDGRRLQFRGGVSAAEAASLFQDGRHSPPPPTG